MQLQCMQVWSSFWDILMQFLSIQLFYDVSAEDIYHQMKSDLMIMNNKMMT